MIEVFQAEWCPYSGKVRERLTELGFDFVARQVAPDREQRDAMRDAVGTDEIPVVVLEDGEVLKGDTDTILATLRERFPDGADAQRHREKAEAHES